MTSDRARDRRRRKPQRRGGTVNATENRLTDQDRKAIAERVATTVSDWRSHGSQWTPSASDVTTLERIAHHAIGCTEADLREVELEEIRRAIVEQLGLGNSLHQ